jgi:hypothetical protein
MTFRKLATLSAAIVLALLMAQSANAQSCNPVAVHLILRDDKNVPLTEKELETIAVVLPDPSQASLEVGEVSIAADQKTFYWPESTDWDKGKKVHALILANAATCTMNLTEATLTKKNQKMRLVFNLEFERSTPDRRPVIELPMLSSGSYKLDLTGWSHDREAIIPATRWKSIRN